MLSIKSSEDLHTTTASDRRFCISWFCSIGNSGDLIKARNASNSHFLHFVTSQALAFGEAARNHFLFFFPKFVSGVESWRLELELN